KKAGGSVAEDNRTRRVVFGRIGWMRAYDGPREGDKRPIGGGSHNKSDIGHEAYNFHTAGGRLYGYFKPSMRSDALKLERIDPLAADKSSIGEGTTLKRGRGCAGRSPAHDRPLS